MVIWDLDTVLVTEQGKKGRMRLNLMDSGWTVVVRLRMIGVREGEFSLSQTLSLININCDYHLRFPIKSSKRTVPYSQKVSFHIGTRDGIYHVCQVLINNLIKNCAIFLDNDVLKEQRRFYHTSAHTHTHTHTHKLKVH